MNWKQGADATEERLKSQFLDALAPGALLGSRFLRW
jgi:hypothetical protein